LLPVPGVASLYTEIAPGMAIHQVIDTALKGTRVQPATLVVERAYGMLEVHHEDKGEVRTAGDAILAFLGKKESDRIKPKIVSNTIIRAIEPMHAMILDKIRFGSMIEPGQSLFILETEPAAYAVLAAWEQAGRAGNSPVTRLGRAVRKLERILAGRYTEPLDLKKLSQGLGVAYSHLRHAFKAHTGYAPWQYVINLRMARARRLLASSDATLDEIAQELGFHSGFHFSMMFKQAHGVSPRAWHARFALEKRQPRIPKNKKSR